jgi:hypothetical protein
VNTSQETNSLASKCKPDQAYSIIAQRGSVFGCRPLRIPMCCLTLVIFISTAAGQSPKKPTPKVDMSARLAHDRLNVSEVLFATSCATSKSRPQNQLCASNALKDLRQAYRSVSWSSIALPQSKVETKAIWKFSYDRVLFGDDTITLKIYETENNQELFSESRTALSPANDVQKLIEHYAAKIDQERIESQNRAIIANYISAQNAISEKYKDLRQSRIEILKPALNVCAQQRAEKRRVKLWQECDSYVISAADNPYIDRMVQQCRSKIPQPMEPDGADVWDCAYVFNNDAEIKRLNEAQKKEGREALDTCASAVSMSYCATYERDK